ncbi:hypothetical protein [Paraburkholderia sp. J11-2]|uniref:hypothetical protein n=1 Tax=Paraburkholderia sp. J11-2 TaxID=2805431 RepID=UPI002AB6C3AB|nr:hypothetical protein [Paraburkholderia sp. J11-2]
MSVFSASSSLDEELLEDEAPPPPPPPPARVPADVLCVEVDALPLLDALEALADGPVVLSAFEFDDAVPEDAPLPAPLVDVCAPVFALDAALPFVPLP